MAKKQRKQPKHVEKGWAVVIGSVPQHSPYFHCTFNHSILDASVDLFPTRVLAVEARRNLMDRTNTRVVRVTVRES